MELFKITVTARSLVRKNERPGKPPYFTQEVYAHTYDREGNLEEMPRKLVLFIDGPDGKYSAGEYTLAPQSFRMGAYDRLEVSPRLMPLKAQAPAASVKS